MNLTKSDSLELHFESSTDILFISVAQITMAMNTNLFVFLLQKYYPSSSSYYVEIVSQMMDNLFFFLLVYLRWPSVVF